MKLASIITIGGVAQCSAIPARFRSSQRRNSDASLTEEIRTSISDFGETDSLVDASEFNLADLDNDVFGAEDGAEDVFEGLQGDDIDELLVADLDNLTQEELDARIENADLEKLFAEIGESVAAAEGTWLDDLGAALDQDNDDAIEKLLDEITDDEIDELLAVIEDALSVAGINTAENSAENSQQDTAEFEFNDGVFEMEVNPRFASSQV
jgi:hypothetical protein